MLLLQNSFFARRPRKPGVANQQCKPLNNPNLKTSDYSRKTSFDAAEFTRSALPRNLLAAMFTILGTRFGSAVAAVVSGCTTACTILATKGASTNKMLQTAQRVWGRGSFGEEAKDQRHQGEVRAHGASHRQLQLQRHPMPHKKRSGRGPAWVVREREHVVLEYGGKAVEALREQVFVRNRPAF